MPILLFHLHYHFTDENPCTPPHILAWYGRPFHPLPPVFHVAKSYLYTLDGVLKCPKASADAGQLTYRKMRIQIYFHSPSGIKIHDLGF
jgi:hypothetical protein